MVYLHILYCIGMTIFTIFMIRETLKVRKERIDLEIKLGKRNGK